MRTARGACYALIVLLIAMLACSAPTSSTQQPAVTVIYEVVTATPGDAATQPPGVAPTSQPVEGSGGPGPAIGGCAIFPADSIWNTPVDTLPVHARSDDYIEAIGSDVNLHADFGTVWEGAPIGIPYMAIPADTPEVDITFYYPDESDPGPYRIPPDPEIEGGPDSDGDRHIILVEEGTCRLVEIYDAYPAGDGSWEAGAGAIWDLTSHALRPDTWTSADAAGLPILPGLVRYDEVAAGEINHAIRFTVEETQQAYVWPARHYASDITDESFPPMGQRFRLKTSFDISSYPPDIQVILRAMQRYGVILADNGSSWYISGSPDPRWDDEALHDAFESVHGSDFEAVDVSSLMIDPDSGQARQP